MRRSAHPSVCLCPLVEDHHRSLVSLTWQVKENGAVLVHSSLGTRLPSRLEREFG